MAVKISTKIIYKLDPSILGKKFPRMAKRAMMAAATIWKDAFLPKHFAEGATARYGYKKLSMKYQSRKSRRWGHRRPYVWSGALMRTATTGAKVRASKFRGSVTIPVTPGIRALLKHSGHDIQADLTVLTSREIQVLAERIQKEVDRAIARLPATKKYVA